ncbi:ferredoxin family protein [Candidatus Bathyarchaeota archaeon]|nr:ferredoxin family protein [Candidatus Bathyarchaeota archaeon]
MGLPRGEIPWFPRINYEKCTGRLTCVETDRNAGHHVYEVEGDPPRPVVKNPYCCVVGCQACARFCPNNAIIFHQGKNLNRCLKS